LSPLVGETFSLSKLVLRFLASESGATAVEYALMAGGIAMTVIATVNTIGSQLSATFYSKLAVAFK
jgi:pilus assembly protein Flp/PilA